jgi:hypothetical protein
VYKRYLPFNLKTNITKSWNRLRSPVALLSCDKKKMSYLHQWLWYKTILFLISFCSDIFFISLTRTIPERAVDVIINGGNAHLCKSTGNFNHTCHLTYGLINVIVFSGCGVSKNWATKKCFQYELHTCEREVQRICWTSRLRLWALSIFYYYTQSKTYCCFFTFNDSCDFPFAFRSRNLVTKNIDKLKTHLAFCDASRQGDIRQ